MENTTRSFLIFVLLCLLVSVAPLQAHENQTQSRGKLPDTGQTGDYTATFGEDSDYLINPPSFTDNGNGTITDIITELVWQKVDGGEMTFENAITYCDTLVLGGVSDWHLPNSHELFSILNLGKNRPAMDTMYFPRTLAEYWWSSDRQVDDATKVWSANSGGGIGAHPKSETLSAGGTKRFHVRAVRNSTTPAFPRFRDNGDSTITDLTSGLTWQSFAIPTRMTWEDALTYSETLTLAGRSDWRLPNSKELQSLNDELRKNPSLDTSYFKNISVSNYWTSSTLIGQPTRAWYVNFAYGLITYDLKTQPFNVLCVRGVPSQLFDFPSVTLIRGGDFSMGDHHGYVDPQHPSDELPLHLVHVDSFYIGTFELNNQQYCDYLNSAKSQGLIEVRNSIVYGVGDTNAYFLTNQNATYSSIGWNGTNFSVIDFRSSHPVVGVMWFGAAAYCNWLSLQLGLPTCYNLTTWNCDFTKNGVRLPTEAEWEYAGRAGQNNPYYIFPWGNDSTNLSLANWPSSGDPYETGAYPWTTPIGFYNGQLRQKVNYNWPGSQSSYQTSNGANAFGLYDMAGNVWEFVNDWYGQNYYSLSPYSNPKGPATGFIMPDGKPYRGMRGGNWYNGQWGHSRVANRNPSYYRGPQDPNHPWYHVGFRVARYVLGSTTGVNEQTDSPSNFRLYQNYPNPFNPSTTISFSLPREERVVLKVYDMLGQEITTLVDGTLAVGLHSTKWDSRDASSGVYFYRIQAGEFVGVKKMVLTH
jgi:formylglycine-generating enzyme required for sulfatase activity